ncbi:MAG: hypothetical protein R3D59_07100 [Paracoccaceae bacterium]
MTTETAGFYNTVGFNGDTRAFMSIPPATTYAPVERRLPRHTRLLSGSAREDEAFESSDTGAHRLHAKPTGSTDPLPGGLHV